MPCTSAQHTKDYSKHSVCLLWCVFFLGGGMLKGSVWLLCDLKTSTGRGFGLRSCSLAASPVLQSWPFVSGILHPCEQIENHQQFLGLTHIFKISLPPQLQYGVEILKIKRWGRRSLCWLRFNEVVD